jgi:hypothetical protein
MKHRVSMRGLKRNTLENNSELRLNNYILLSEFRKLPAVVCVNCDKHDVCCAPWYIYCMELQRTTVQSSCISPS